MPPQYYHPQRKEGTFIGHYRHHTIHNPFFNIGLTDLTAHVNFTDIARAGTELGLDLIGYLPQSYFLLNLGITDLLAQIGITVNRNAVPFDPRPPRVTSGLRIGTPALATRGFGAAEFGEVAEIIAAVLKAGATDSVSQEPLETLRGRVTNLTKAFPLYPGLVQ